MSVPVVRPFRPDDQAAARALILDGLEEHWGTLDPGYNRDLDDIGQAFAGGDFWVAEVQGRVHARVVSRLWRGPRRFEEPSRSSPEATDNACVHTQGQIIGTAGLLVRGPDTGEIVRVSVARAWRRAGLGRRLLAALVVAAEARGLSTLTTETTASWADAVAFYDRLGFQRTHISAGDQYFALTLSPRPEWAT